MSLATDILNSLNKAAPPKPAKKPKAPRDTRKPAAPKHAKTKPPVPRVFGRTREPAAGRQKVASPNVPYVYPHDRSGGYQAKLCRKTGTVHLGIFGEVRRASLAVKLFQLWERRGMDNIPRKPERRLYTNW